MGEIVDFPISEHHRHYWEQVLENAERMRENALRELGRLPLDPPEPPPQEAA